MPCELLLLGHPNTPKVILTEPWMISKKNWRLNALPLRLNKANLLAVAGLTEVRNLVVEVTVANVLTCSY